MPPYSPPAMARFVDIAAPCGVVVQFVSDLQNLPHWATDFCRGLRQIGTGFRVETPEGFVSVETRMQLTSGVVDFVVTPQEGPIQTFWTRSMHLGANRTLFSFTWVRPRGAPWDDFDRDWHILDGELHALKHALEDGR